MHVDRGEARAIEGRRHFDRAVDALLAQDRHPRLDAGRDKRRGDVLVDRVGQGGRQRQIAALPQGRVLLARARCVIAQLADPVAGLGPDGVQVEPALVNQRPATRTDTDAPVDRRVAEGADVRGEPVAREHGERGGDVRVGHLDHGTGLLGEQRCHGIGDRTEIGMDARVRRKRHLGQRHEQPAVGAVVVGEQPTGRGEFADGGEETAEQGRVVDVGRHVTERAVHLREAGPAEARLAGTEVDHEQR